MFTNKAAGEFKRAELQRAFRQQNAPPSGRAQVRYLVLIQMNGSLIDPAVNAAAVLRNKVEGVR